VIQTPGTSPSQPPTPDETPRVGQRTGATAEPSFEQTGAAQVPSADDDRPRLRSEHIGTVPLSIRRAPASDASLLPGTVRSRGRLPFAADCRPSDPRRRAMLSRGPRARASALKSRVATTPTRPTLGRSRLRAMSMSSADAFAAPATPGPRASNARGISPAAQLPEGQLLRGQPPRAASERRRLPLPHGLMPVGHGAVASQASHERGADRTGRARVQSRRSQRG
jgi:hypothetical protein